MAVAAQKRAADAARRKRINRLKKIIIGTILAAILIPCVISGVLIWKVLVLNEQLQESEAKCEALLEAMAEGNFHLDDEYFPEEIVEEEVVIPVPEEPASVDETHTRKVYLTFDDGTS